MAMEGRDAGEEEADHETTAPDAASGPDGASSREIARVLGVARSTIQENLKRALDAGLSWPLPGELTDDTLEQRLFDRAGVKQGTRRRPEPNWASWSWI